VRVCAFAIARLSGMGGDIANFLVFYTYLGYKGMGFQQRRININKKILLTFQVSNLRAGIGLGGYSWKFE